MTATRKTRIVSIVFILLCFLGAAGFLAYSYLRVESVDVLGNDKISKERIVTLSGILLDESMFNVDLEDVEERIRQEPYIDVLSIKRKLPSGIEIEVREREPIAAVVSGSSMIIIDEAGVALEFTSQDPGTYIIVRGIDLRGGSKAAEPIVTADDFQGTSLLNLFVALKGADRLGDVESIDIANPLDIRLKLHGGLTIMLGAPEEMPSKLAWLETVEPRLEELGLFDGTLDVTSGVSARYVPRRDEFDYAAESDFTDDSNSDSIDNTDTDDGDDTDADGAEPADDGETPEPLEDYTQPDEQDPPNQGD